MTISESLRELARFHDEKRKESLGPGGRVTEAASYHAELSDAAARAASFVEVANRK